MADTAPAVGSDAVPDMKDGATGSGSATDKKSKSETVKLTHLFKHESILKTIMKFCPYIWVKLKMTNRLFIWRLDENRFADTIQWLNAELNLTSCNPHMKAAEGWGSPLFCTYINMHFVLHILNIHHHFSVNRGGLIISLTNIPGLSILSGCCWFKDTIPEARTMKETHCSKKLYIVSC